MGGVLYPVEYCEEQIANAQYVLDHREAYEVEARVDADKSLRRWTTIRDHAEAIAVRERLLRWALDYIGIDWDDVWVDEPPSVTEARILLARAAERDRLGRAAERANPHHTGAPGDIT
jgi:hypothetical protein